MTLSGRTAAFSYDAIAHVPSRLFSGGTKQTDWAVRSKELETDHQRFEDRSIDSSSHFVVCTCKTNSSRRTLAHASRLASAMVVPTARIFLCTALAHRCVSQGCVNILEETIRDGTWNFTSLKSSRMKVDTASSTSKPPKSMLQFIPRKSPLGAYQFAIL